MANTNISKIKDKNLFRNAIEFLTIGNIGVNRAIEESISLGLPVVFGYMNTVLFRMPDGTITSKSPYKKIVQKKKN